MPVAGHVGSDYPRLRPEFRVIDNPWTPGQPVLLVPAIRPDLALIHALAAAPDGTLLLEPTEDDALLAQASRVVLASAERLVPREALAAAGDGVLLPGIHVTGVIEAPGGARPTAVRGAYPVDAQAIRAYVAAARDEATFKRWLDAHVYG